MAANENLDQYLPQTRKIALFGYLTDQELQGILEHAEIVHYPEGEKIVSQDEVSEYLFAIIKGMVKVTVRDQDEDVFICNIEEGEAFGEAALFMTEKRTANVISAGNTVAFKIHRKDMLAYIKSNPHAGNKILMLLIYSLLKKLGNTNQEIALEKQSDINSEYIDYLVEEFLKDNLT